MRPKIKARNLAQPLVERSLARHEYISAGASESCTSSREYQSTMHWRGLTRPNAALRKKGASADEAIEL